MPDHAHRQAARVALTDKDQALELLAHLVSQLDPKDVLALIPDSALQDMLERVAEATVHMHGLEELMVRAVYHKRDNRWVYSHAGYMASSQRGIVRGELPGPASPPPPPSRPWTRVMLPADDAVKRGLTQQ